MINYFEWQNAISAALDKHCSNNAWTSISTQQDDNYDNVDDIAHGV